MIKEGDIVKYNESDHFYKVIRLHEFEGEIVSFTLFRTDGYENIISARHLPKMIVLPVSIEEFDFILPRKVSYIEWCNAANKKEVIDRDNEKWFNVQGFEGLYKFSNLGRVKDLNAYGYKGCEEIVEKIGEYGHGYIPEVCLYRKGQKNIFRLDDLAKMSLPKDVLNLLLDKWNHILSEYFNKVNSLKDIDHLEKVDFLESEDHESFMSTRIIYQETRSTQYNTYRIKITYCENGLFDLALDKIMLRREKDKRSPFYYKVIGHRVESIKIRQFDEDYFLEIYAKLKDKHVGFYSIYSELKKHKNLEVDRIYNRYPNR